MNSDFTQPQRQSLIGVVVMFADTLQKLIRALVPVFIGLIFQINKINKWYLGAGLLVFFVIVAVVAYLRYRNFTFYIDEETEEFIINEGIFNKSRLAIPLDKIQQVNINQSLLQRIIDVHSLEVDTAGTSKQEVSIKAIPQALATSLKARLMEGAKSEIAVAAATIIKEATETKSFISISLLRLLKTGVTSNYARSLGLLIAFVISTFQYIEDYFEAAGYDEDPLDDYINPEMVLRFLTFIIVGVMALIIVINLTRTIIINFGYKILRQRGSLLLSYGLINTRNIILRPNKIQYLTTRRNFFQKKLNVQDLNIHQASDHEINVGERKKVAIEIPGLSSAEKDDLLKLLLGVIPEKGAMLKPNFRKMLVPTFFGLIVPLSIYFGISFTVGPEALNFINFVPVYVLFVGLLIYFAFRHCRLFVSEDFIIKQSGAWDIDVDYLEPHKIQSVELKQYFWQKGADIGIVTLHTAGGQISFGLANYTKLKHYANYWLYQVEKENKGWM
ncbi:MAG: PH domain-containing protein [Flavobacterium sp.]